MPGNLLDKTRKVTRLLQTTSSQSMRFSDMCEILGELLASDVYVISRKGKILGLNPNSADNKENIIYNMEIGEHIPEKQNEEFLYLNETRANLESEDLKNFKNDTEMQKNSSITIVPISSGGERLGTLVLYKNHGLFDDDDLVLAEYGAAVVGIEILRSISIENETEIRKKAVVQLALGSLSYSEMEAVINIFNELEGTEGLLVASKIADKVGITRSVIVNALRKFESAGVIESRSLGMKGTHIKILNEKLLEEIEKISVK